MHVSNRIPPAVLAAAAGMLQPFVPELSPQNLVDALKAHSGNGQAQPQFEKPMTIREVAELLGVSLATVNNYLNAGKLRRISASRSFVRVDPESVRQLLGYAEARP